MHAVRQDVGVAHRPGERTTLTVRGKTVIDVRRSPGGFLQFNGEEWARNLTVPNPRGGNPHWCTRGAAMQSLEEHGTRMLQTSLTRQESLSKRRAEKALHEFAQTDLGGLDPQLSGRLLTGVQSMVDQEAWMLAQSRSAHVTLDGYNTALGAMRHLKELLESNPAALEWALAYAEPREEIHHPGQIIELARRSSEQAGLPAGSWRRTSGIPARIVRGIIEKANPMGAAAILGAIARSGAVPEKQIALAALQVLVPKGQRSVPGETTVRLRFELTVRVQAGPGANGEPVPENAARRREQQREQQREKQREQNLERVLRLLFRESARERSSNQRAAQRAIADELPDLRDYLNARNSQELPVRATTWRGLLKASRAWHQEMRIAPIRQRWANILAARGGQYLRWAMPTGNIELDGTEPGQLEIDGLEIIPLLDEHALYEESLEMLHCVIQYGDRCASGKTLVVSLRENGERVATGEIVMTPQGWREQQTRGRRNHQGTDRARQAVQRLAEICNRNPTGAGIPG